ncbi:MAG: barstar family protein [Azonexus sp.]|nr:barstar family protein [Azonexus sp.]MCK6411390.1 barstar family protein [Azonexus sp.]
MADPILERTELAGPYWLPPARRTALLDTLGSPPLVEVREIAPEHAETGADWLAELGRKLAFPTSFGANFDALFDALCDRELLPQETLVLCLGRLDPLGEEGLDTLIAVLQAAADEWREENRRLWALFDVAQLDLDPLPDSRAARN